MAIGFLSLPAEVRVMIYRYALVQPDEILCPQHHRNTRFRDPELIAPYKDRKYNLNSVILVASKLIYAEASHILYRENTFGFVSLSTKHDLFHRFWRSIPVGSPFRQIQHAYLRLESAEQKGMNSFKTFLARHEIHLQTLTLSVERRDQPGELAALAASLLRDGFVARLFASTWIFNGRRTLGEQRMLDIQLLSGLPAWKRHFHMSPTKDALHDRKAGPSDIGASFQELTLR